MPVRIRESLIEFSGLDAPQLPAAATLGSARLYYDTEARALMLSVDGEPYAPTSSGASAAAANQASWFIDPAAGDDGNDGLTASTALATWAEYAARIGDQVCPVQQIVTLLGNLSEGEYRIRGTYPLGLIVQGQRTFVRTGTVSVIQAWNTAVTPIVDQRITDNTLPANWNNSGPAGSSLIGRLLVMTSGALVGFVAYAIADLSAITPKMARVSQFVNTATFATGTPAVATTFDIFDLTTMNGVVILDNPQSGAGFVDLVDVIVLSPAGPPLLGSAGSIAAAPAIFRQTTGGGNFMSNCQGTFIGALFGSGCHLGIADTQNFLLASCAFIDARIELLAARFIVTAINPMQRLTAGLFIADNQLTIQQGSIASVQGSLGAHDLNGAAQAMARINAGGILDITGVVYTLATIAGFGVFVDAVASALWTAGGSAVTFGRFNGGTEWRIGGVNTTSAALAAVGSITAANHAAAVPHPT